MQSLFCLIERARPRRDAIHRVLQRARRVLQRARRILCFPKPI